MKRIAILAATVALFASTAAVAFADDDAGGEEAESETTKIVDHTEDPFEEQLWQVQLLARYKAGDEAYETDPEAAEDEIALLRTGDDKTGWGAIFKLIQLYKLHELQALNDGSTPMTFDEMVAQYGEEGWGFGKRFKDYEGEDGVSLEDGPKNLGQLKKQDREENGTHGKKPKKP
jgi:hypothetical protein